MWVRKTQIKNNNNNKKKTGKGENMYSFKKKKICTAFLYLEKETQETGNFAASGKGNRTAGGVDCCCRLVAK